MSFNDLIDDTVKRALNFTNGGGSGSISYIYGGSNISVVNPSGPTPTIYVSDPLVNNEVDTDILTATTAIKSNLIENLTNDELIIRQNGVSSILLNTDGNGGVTINSHIIYSNASSIFMDTNGITLNTAYTNYINLQNDGAISIGAKGSSEILLYIDGSIDINGDGHLSLNNNSIYVNGGEFILYNADSLHFTSLFSDTNGNLHALVNGTTDYQLTPPSGGGTATNVVSDTIDGFPTIIYAVNESTDSGSQSYIRILNILTQNNITGNYEVFTLDQKGASDTAQPYLKFVFQDQDDNFLPFTFQTSTTDGGIKLDNSTNTCRLYPDIDGNLHAVVDNYGSPIDYKLTPNTTVSQLVYNSSTDVTPTVISMTNTTDGSFIPNLNVLQASLQSEMDGEVQTNSIFQIAYNGSSASGGNCDVYLFNQNITTGLYNRIWVFAPDATDGGFVIANPANSSTCILYCDNLGNLHSVVSSGNIDSLITGLNPFSFNGILSPITINQAACPVLINNIDAIPPQNIYVKNNAIINISINGSVEPTAQESPSVGGIAPDMITLGFNVIFYYSNDVEGIVPLTTTLKLYCSTIFGGSYPISCSFTEIINTGYVDGSGFCSRISIEVIFVNGYNTGNNYGFNFNNVNATITPQNH
jgi:hypothetical protein